MASAIDVQLKQFPNGAFIRLGSRSPKDSFPALKQGMKCTEGKHAVDMLVDSKRVHDDLYVAKSNNYIPHIALREWINIQPWQEFRCFYKQGELVGISQYDYFKKHLPQIEENLQGILLALEIKSKGVAKCLPYDGTIIVDYVYQVKHKGNEHINKAILLEVNPWTLLTDPCLFNWHTDKFEKPEIRYIDQSGNIEKVSLHELVS